MWFTYSYSSSIVAYASIDQTGRSVHHAILKTRLSVCPSVCLGFESVDGNTCAATIAAQKMTRRQNKKITTVIPKYDTLNRFDARKTS